jgi:hypothetical protein
VFKAGESYDLTGWRKSMTEVAAFTFAPLPESYAARTGRPADVGVIGIAVFDEQAPVAVSTYAAPEARSDLADDSDRPSSRGVDGVAAQRRASPVEKAPVAITAFTGTAGSVAPVDTESRASQPPPPALARMAQSLGDAAGADVVTAERRDERLGTAHGAREWSVLNIVPFERATSYPQFVRQIEYDTHDHLVASGVILSWRPQEHRPTPFPSNSGDEGFVPDPPG